MIRWVYDVEVYTNIFTATFLNYDNDDKFVFEISERKNDLIELNRFLSGNIILLGFNNENYDNTILNIIIKSYNRFINTSRSIINSEIKLISDYIVNDHYDGYKQYKWGFKIPYIDIFLYWSKMLRISKKLSLKSLAINMNWHKIQELPIEPDELVDINQIDNLLSYNLNDVEITKELFKLKSKDINLRYDIKKKYGIECLNKDPIKIASDILAKYYSEEKKLKWDEFKNIQTNRSVINIKDIILDKFEFTETNEKISYDAKALVVNSPYTLLNHLKKRTVTTTTELNYYIVEDNIDGVLKSDFGSGGIHALSEVRIAEESNTHMIITSDIASLYPTTIIENKFIPEHLGIEFLNVYKNIKSQRLEAKKNGDRVTNETLKLCLNGSYGLFNNDYSWLKDSQTVLSVTLFGQLLLTTCSQKCIKNGIKVLALNTDSIDVFCPRDKEELYYSIIKDIEDKFLVEFEHDNYKKIIYRDINNYIGITTLDKIKQKGIFTTKPLLDQSNDSLIIPLSLEAYFIKNIPVEDFIINHNNIYDFCIAQKCDKKYSVFWNNQKQQRLNRYYVSKKGAFLYKSKDDGNTLNHMMKGWGVQLFNNYQEKEMKDYNIDYRYYISKTKEIIQELEPIQMNLFN